MLVMSFYYSIALWARLDFYLPGRHHHRHIVSFRTSARSPGCSSQRSPG